MTTRREWELDWESKFAANYRFLEGWELLEVKYSNGECVTLRRRAILGWPSRDFQYATWFELDGHRHYGHFFDNEDSAYWDFLYRSPR